LPGAHRGRNKENKMFLLNKYKIKLRHPKSTFLYTPQQRQTNTGLIEKHSITYFRNQKMNFTQTTSRSQVNFQGVLKSIKYFFSDLFSDKQYLQKKEQFMLIKELQLKTFEIEHLKRELAEKNDILKKMSFHQSHTVRRPLANILGITKLIHAYIKEHPDADLSQLISFLGLSSDELDHAIKCNN